MYEEKRVRTVDKNHKASLHGDHMPNVSWNLSAPLYVGELKNDHLLLCHSPGLFYSCVPLQ